jgi:hypothetical protein
MYVMVLARIVWLSLCKVMIMWHCVASGVRSVDGLVAAGHAHI